MGAYISMGVVGRVLIGAWALKGTNTVCADRTVQMDRLICIIVVFMYKTQGL